MGEVSFYYSWRYSCANGDGIEHHSCVSPFEKFLVMRSCIDINDYAAECVG